MGEKVTLEAAIRETTGKQVAKLRRTGEVPAVAYGSQLTPKNIQFSQQEAQRVVKSAGRHTPVQLTINGKTRSALIKSVEYAPASREITHISFQAVRADEVVTTEVPLILAGAEESAAAKAGLIILPTLEQVEVRAKTADLPSELTIDASGLAAEGDKLEMSAVKLPKDVEIVDFNPEQVIASVTSSAAMEAKNAAADAAADEERAEDTATETNPAEDVPATDEKTE
jgi:large subunit ribosomal protein L25